MSYWLFVTKDTGVRFQNGPRFADAILGVATDRESALNIARFLRANHRPFDVYTGGTNDVNDCTLVYSVNNIGEESNVVSRFLMKEDIDVI